ncbi:MAG: hypothetical protein QGG40_19560, partial [Myxococcota bacterium]|nr:hypothetical protein [Myxococcota bacterium]
MIGLWLALILGCSKQTEEICGDAASDTERDACLVERAGELLAIDPRISLRLVRSVRDDQARDPALLEVLLEGQGFGRTEIRATCENELSTTEARLRCRRALDHPGSQLGKSPSHQPTVESTSCDDLNGDSRDLCLVGMVGRADLSTLDQVETTLDRIESPSLRGQAVLDFLLSIRTPASDQLPLLEELLRFADEPRANQARTILAGELAFRPIRTCTSSTATEDCERLYEDVVLP